MSDPAVIESAEPVAIPEKKKRTRKSGRVAARMVRLQSKSSAPIFFDKTIVHIIKKHAPPKTRVTRGAMRALRAILERKAVDFARKSYMVSRVLRGDEGVVRLMPKDAELVRRLDELGEI